MKYQARIQSPSGNQTTVVVEADNETDAIFRTGLICGFPHDSILIAIQSEEEFYWS